MFYHNNEYLIPIIAGGSREAFDTARKIRIRRRQDAHIFAERFSIFKRIAYRCHKVYSEKDVWLLNSLIDFIELMEEPYCAALIVYDEKSRAFAQKYAEELEVRCLIIEEKDLLCEE